MKATGIVQGNPPNHAYPRGRPVTDYIDTVGAILLRDGGFSEATGVVSGTIQAIFCVFT